MKDCAACLLSGKTGHQAPPPLQPLAWPSQPWDHLQLDICGEIQGVPHHQRFLVVVYDLHSKWPELIATGSVTSQVIINFLDSLFSRWGLPNTVTTDNGPQLISAEFTTYLQNKGIHHIRTAYYHPQANGGVERFHQSLKNSLRAHLFQGWTFSRAIHHTLLHYRATQHSTTGVSPAFLMLGRELHLPLDRLSPALPKGPLPNVRASVTRQQRGWSRNSISQHVLRSLTLRPQIGSGFAGPTEITNSLHIGLPSPNYSSAGPSHLLAQQWHTVARKPPPQSAATSTYNRRHTSSHTSSLAGHPSIQLTPQIAPAQAPDMPINLPAEICACPSQTAPPHPLVSPRPVRIRSRPGHLQDFVSTVHVWNPVGRGGNVMFS